MASCSPSMELFRFLIYYLLDINKTGDEDFVKRGNYIRLSKAFEPKRKMLLQI